MSAVVVLAIALAIVSAVVVGLVAVQLLRAVRRVRALLTATLGRIQPLVDDLQAETAVTALEVEALQNSVEQLRQRSANRGGGRHRTSA